MSSSGSPPTKTRGKRAAEGESPVEEQTSPRGGSRKHPQKKIKEDEHHHVIIYVPQSGKSAHLRRVDVEKHPAVEKYLDMTKVQLQQWLRHNAQLVTGTKQQLLLRCVDGQLNGRIPQCPRCHHGRMQYDYSQGLYVCNGYFDKQSRTPIRCGHTEEEVKREKWHDLENDPAIKLEDDTSSDEEKAHKHHHAKVEKNSDLVDILEEMAYLHSVVKDENWNYKSRAFKTAAQAIESLDFEVTDAREIGDRRDKEHHVERIGKTSSEVMQAYLDSGRTRCPQLEDLKRLAKEHAEKEKSSSD